MAICQVCGSEAGDSKFRAVLFLHGDYIINGIIL